VREVEIQFEPEPDLPAAPCSKDLVQQILLNFVFNAVESATSDKHINIITYASSSVPNGAVLQPAAAGSYVSISVRDRGAGIAPDVLPRVFEPFFTTKALSSRRGTGLGLSMVYEFAKKLNAGLAVESIVGEGSTFTLILPAGQSVAQSLAARRPDKKKPFIEQPASHS
jgi:signal transduction histidine kinase